MNKHNNNQKQGAAMLFFIIFFVVASSSLTFLLSRSISSDLYTVSSLSSAKQSYLTAESALEDIVLRVMSSDSYASTNVLADIPGTATTTVTHDVSDDEYEIKTESKVGRSIKIDWVILSIGAGTAFNYGLQTGNGGFDLVNSASIIGNAFSNGPIQGQGSSIIRGDVISASSTGLVDGIHATGSVWTNTLNNSWIEGDAYYDTGSSNTIDGTIHSPATIPDPEPLPIPDSEVQEWKDRVSSTGSTIPASACTSGEFLIDTDTTIGNVKIECDFRVRKKGSGVTVTLTGPIWVTGNITFEQGPKLAVDPGLNSNSVQIIADNPADRLNSSKISISNSTEFEGSGHDSSFVMMLSQNESSEMGGSGTAIDIGQSSSGDLILYAGHGKIDIGNQIHLKSVTGHKIDIGNNSDITYDSGLMSTIFTGGVSGGFVISEWYQE